MYSGWAEFPFKKPEEFTPSKSTRDQWALDPYSELTVHICFCFESFVSGGVCLFASCLLNNTKVKQRHGFHVYINSKYMCQVSCPLLSIECIFYLLLPCANLPLHNNFPKHEQHRIAGDSAQQNSDNFPKNTSTPQHRTGLVVSTHLRKNLVKLDDFPKVRGKNKKSSNHLRSHPTRPNLRADGEWPYGLL